jgi:DNA-binding response OmpR family regulator
MLKSLLYNYLISGDWAALKILIVDDEIRISNLLRIYLQRESFHVDAAADGDEGLDKALHENYDLIILDVLMPGKDGFQVLEDLRKVKQTPVIMLSAKSESEDLIRGTDLGANAFISKPFSPAAVVAKIKEILSPARQ